MPKSVISSVGGLYLRDAKNVVFQWGQSDALESLSKVMANGFAGCVHFTLAQCEIKVLILLYMAEKKAYLGFIPNDQTGYVERLKRVIQLNKNSQLANQQSIQVAPGNYIRYPIFH